MGSTAMPQYHFRLSNGREVLEDPDGLLLPGPAAAREEGAKFAKDLAEGRVLERQQDWSGWRVQLIDEDGREIEAIPIIDTEQP
jgi:hypothetical protein